MADKKPHEEVAAARYRHLLGKVIDAKNGGLRAWSVQSTGEQVAVALALNRADWLSSMGYTIAMAIDRTGPEWLEMIPRAAREAAGA